MSEYSFEGTPVVDHQAKIPAITVDCDHYPAGTELRLAMTVRVRGVNHEEDKEGNFIRSHKLGIQEIEVVSSYDPSQARDQVGGSLAAGALASDDETGLSPGLTGDQWPAGVARDPDTGTVVNTETGEVIEMASNGQHAEAEGEVDADMDVRPEPSESDDEDNYADVGF